MQTLTSQDQLNRIESRLSHLTQLLERLIGKIEQDDDSIFYKLVRSKRFKKELREDLESLKKDPSEFTDLHMAYRQQKTQ